ncbi:MAG: winged helix-turn-helix domain-containing protein [Anaerolineae bacterium]|nr:winged helix-turn-helix domain-containing protein [Anaerolineae bacterium]
MTESSSRQSPYFIDPTGREHLLEEEHITIGRAVENTIVITSKRISRSHASVQRDGWRRILEDLNSTNGTFLNGERVLSSVELHDGDRVLVGDVELVYHDPDITVCATPFPELEIDIAGGVVRVDRHIVPLSSKEFDLLAYLYEMRGQVCSKDDIGIAVWPEYEGSVYDYQIENLVRRLRTKLEPDPTDPQLLVTVRGLGYKLVTRD